MCIRIQTVHHEYKCEMYYITTENCEQGIRTTLQDNESTIVRNFWNMQKSLQPNPIIKNLIQKKRTILEGAIKCFKIKDPKLNIIFG